MSISDLDASEFSLYTNTVQNIKEATRDIISKRREINHKNSENVILKEIQLIDDDNSDSTEDVVTVVQNTKAQSDDVCVVIEETEVTVQQNSRPRRKSRRNKTSTVTDNSCVPSSSTVGQRRRNSKRKKTNNIIVLDEEYPEPVSSSWVGTQRRKLAEDSIIVESGENSLDLTANVPDMYEDENEEVTIVVKWKQMDIHKFQIRRFQNLSSVFEFFANKECVTTDEILLLRNDKEIQQSDSPESLDFKCIAMLDGDIKLNRIFYGKSTKSIQGEEELINLEENCLTVKVQAKHLKQPIEMTIKREQKMNILIIKCCEKFNCPQNKLTLKFDGEVLNPKDTPDDLCLEGGECFDAYIH